MKQAMFNRFGAPSKVIECIDVPDVPEPSDWEVTVEIMASPVNPSDISVLRGQYGNLPANFPATTGLEASAKVVAAGKSVKDYSIGDRVILIVKNNWTQRRNVPATGLHPMPDWMSFEQASMVKVNAACAVLMLNSLGNLQSGDYLLVNAPMSAVGQMLVRFAAEKGIKTVCVVRRETAIQDVLSIGGTFAVVDGDDLKQQVDEATGGVPIGIAFDAVAGDAVARLADCLSVGGTIVSYGMLSGQNCQLRPDQTIFRNVSLQGFWLWKELSTLKFKGRRDLLNESLELIKTCQVENEVAARFPIEEVAAAVEASESEGNRGKVLILPNGPLD